MELGQRAEQQGSENQTRLKRTHPRELSLGESVAQHQDALGQSAVRSIGNSSLQHPLHPRGQLVHVDVVAACLLVVVVSDEILGVDGHVRGDLQEEAGEVKRGR